MQEVFFKIVALMARKVSAANADGEEHSECRTMSL